MRMVVEIAVGMVVAQIVRALLLAALRMVHVRKRWVLNYEGLAVVEWLLRALDCY